jgi:hypothetical protein
MIEEEKRKRRWRWWLVSGWKIKGGRLRIGGTGQYRAVFLNVATLVPSVDIAQY